MKEFIIKEILDRYEKAMQEVIYYKQRVERHEQQIRAANRENMHLKSDRHFLEAQLDELKNKEQ